MPSHSGKRSHEMSTKRWSGGRNSNQRRDDRRTGSMQGRIMGGGGGGRLMVSPWENGMTPGMQSNLISQNSFGQQASNSYFVNSGLNRGSFGTSNYAGFGNNASKLRRYDRMGGYDDQRGRGLLPSPSPSNTPLLGVAPPAFTPAASGPEFLQQRIGLPWESSFRSGGPRGMGSGYYPSDRGHQDKSRKFIKAKRPLSKPLSKGNSSRDGKGKARNSTSQSPSVKGREDKERDSSHSKELKSKQGGSSLAKPERSTDSEKDESKDDSQEVEEKGKDQNENGEEANKDETNKDKDDKDKQQEDPFPVKALYCHICELDSFSSRKGYIRHLQGVTHARMAEMFHAKNAATLELLNISAKLSEMRQRDKVLRRTGKKGQPVMKTVEQILVEKWLKVGSCCGMKFKCPFGLEEHKLSIHHLKMKYTLKQKNEKKSLSEGEEPKEKDEQTKEPTEEDAHKEVVRVGTLLEEARKKHLENPLTLQTLGAFNPSIMMGLEFIKEELRFRCTICRGQLFKSLENHCQSHAHFDNIASHLNKMEDTKREEERKQKEKEEEEKSEEKEKKEEGDKDAAKGEDEDEEGDGELPGEYIMVDCSEDKAKSDDEMDEDVIPFGEDEERILNATEEEIMEMNKEEESKEEVTEENEEQYKEEIFEEIGEKIDLEDDLKKQLDSKEEEEEEEEEEDAAEPPPKKMAYTPRRRGRGRGRGKYSK